MAASPWPTTLGLRNDYTDCLSKCPGILATAIASDAMHFRDARVIVKTNLSATRTAAAMSNYAVRVVWPAE